VVACSLLQPLLHHFSHPDQLNQTLVWLMRDCEVRFFFDSLEKVNGVREKY
jgi:hypothetical protein